MCATTRCDYRKGTEPRAVAARTPMRRALPSDVPQLVAMMTEFYSDSGYTLNPRRATDAFNVLLADERLGYVWFVQWIPIMCFSPWGWQTRRMPLDGAMMSKPRGVCKIIGQSWGTILNSGLQKVRCPRNSLPHTSTPHPQTCAPGRFRGVDAMHVPAAAPASQQCRVHLRRSPEAVHGPNPFADGP